MERLDKFLCDCGVGTRSQVRAIIKSGAVSVDGKPERDSSRKFDPAIQAVALNGEILNRRGRVVVMLNKPSGYVTATQDRREQTVMELLPEEYRRLDLKPVGRLDKATEGLLLFTNDGDLLHKLISPKKEVPKCYYARHAGTATREDVDAFATGLILEDGTKCLPAILKPIGQGESYVTVCEGKYHQVRRMLASRNMPVTYLERQQEGSLTLAGLPRGSVRELSEAEIESLLELGKMTKENA